VKGGLVGETRVTAQKGHNFFLIGGSRSNFCSSLQRLFSLELLWNRYSGTGGLVRETRVTAQKGHKFLSDSWIALKYLEEFIEVVFLGVALESILGDREVWSGETRVTAQKAQNFLSDSWIALKVLEEFIEAVLLEVAMESILSDREVLSGQTRVTT